jgi:DNA-binding beta-propeller fold protein YncE
MDEERLREMLRNATNEEPPIGSIALNALRAGIRLRRKRRIQSASTCAAAVLAIGIAVPAVIGHGHRLAGARHRHGQTVYVVGTTRTGKAVTPIAVPANQAGRPIRIADIPQAAVLSPNGKTLYVEIYQPRAALLPISTRTGKPGRPIIVGGKQPGLPWPLTDAITPNGKMIYLLNETRQFVTPVNLVTGKSGRQIRVGPNPQGLAVDPNGRTAYVLVANAGVVLPINLKTNKPEKAIHVGKYPTNIVITPDGKTAYVSRGREVVPIDTATNKAERPITVGQVQGSVSELAITPDGRTVLAFFGENAGARGQSTTLTPISTSTNRAGRTIVLSNEEHGVAFAPDSRTAYISLARSVVPLRIAADRLGKPIKIPGGLGDFGGSLVITANGKILYVLAADTAGGRHSGLVYPVRTATGTVGRPIRVGGEPSGLVIAP